MFCAHISSWSCYSCQCVCILSTLEHMNSLYLWLVLHLSLLYIQKISYPLISWKVNFFKKYLSTLSWVICCLCCYKFFILWGQNILNLPPFQVFLLLILERMHNFPAIIIPLALCGVLFPCYYLGWYMFAVFYVIQFKIR
jgi:hypothetical protein